MHLRPFDESDWEMISGATKPEYGQPMVYWDEEGCAVVDANGIEVMHIRPGKPPQSWTLEVPSFYAAFAIASSMCNITEEELKKYGFTKMEDW